MGGEDEGGAGEDCTTRGGKETGLLVTGHSSLFRTIALLGWLRVDKMESAKPLKNGRGVNSAKEEKWKEHEKSFNLGL